MCSTYHISVLPISPPGGRRRRRRCTWTEILVRVEQLDGKGKRPRATCRRCGALNRGRGRGAPRAALPCQRPGYPRRRESGALRYPSPPRCQTATRGQEGGQAAPAEHVAEYRLKGQRVDGRRVSRSVHGVYPFSRMHRPTSSMILPRSAVRQVGEMAGAPDRFTTEWLTVPGRCSILRRHEWTVAPRGAQAHEEGAMLYRDFGTGLKVTAIGPDVEYRQSRGVDDVRLCHDTRAYSAASTSRHAEPRVPNGLGGV